jgi:hypothetical protein
MRFQLVPILLSTYVGTAAAGPFLGWGCSSFCSATYATCVGSAGAVTVATAGATAGLGPTVIITCNAAYALCMTGCGVVVVVPGA